MSSFYSSQPNYAEIWSPKLLEIPSFGKEFYPVSNEESSEVIWNASN